MAENQNSAIPTRRAVLAGIPAAAIGAGALVPAAVAGPAEEAPIARMVREYFEAEARCSEEYGLWDFKSGPYPAERIRSCIEQRIAIADMPPRTFEELRMKMAVAFDTCGSDLNALIQEELRAGNAPDVTMAFVIVRDFASLYGVSLQPPPA